MLFQLKDTTVEEITPHDQDGEYVDSGLCPTCWGSEWEDGYVSVKVTFGNGESYTYYRTEDEIQQRGLAGVIDYLFTHLSEFPDMTQQEFIDHLSTDLDKRFGYNDID